MRVARTFPWVLPSIGYLPRSTPLVLPSSESSRLYWASTRHSLFGRLLNWSAGSKGSTRLSQHRVKPSLPENKRRLISKTSTTASEGDLRSGRERDYRVLAGGTWSGRRFRGVLLRCDLSLDFWRRPGSSRLHSEGSLVDCFAHPRYFAPLPSFANISPRASLVPGRGPLLLGGIFPRGEFARLLL
jgi:hypothetical protein